MFCSICLTNSQEYIEIPCGHHLCEPCAQQYMNEDHKLRCPTCLDVFPLHISSKNMRRQEIPNERDRSRTFFCLQCQESFGSHKLKHGLHINHSFQVLQKCLPKIKQMVLFKLNKTLTIENSLLLRIQRQAEEVYYIELENLTKQIQTRFQQERQLLLYKEHCLISEVMQFQEKLKQKLQEKRKLYFQLYEELHQINDKMENFMNDQIRIEKIEALGILKEPIQQNFMKKVKEIEKEAIIIPKFVCLPPRGHNLDSNFFIKYHQSQQNHSFFEEKEKLPPKRVNLLSTIYRKMNCLSIH